MTKTMQIFVEEEKERDSNVFSACSLQLDFGNANQRMNVSLYRLHILLCHSEEAEEWHSDCCTAPSGFPEPFRMGPEASTGTDIAYSDDGFKPSVSSALVPHT